MKYQGSSLADKSARRECEQRWLTSHYASQQILHEYLTTKFLRIHANKGAFESVNRRADQITRDLICRFISQYSLSGIISFSQHCEQLL